MPKVMIWPDVYREHGHWLPAISLAKSLKDAGYAVEFMGIPDCKPIVEAYGGKFNEILQEIYPVGHTVDDRLEPIGQRWKPHHLLPMCRGEQLHNLFDVGTRPDLLIVGYFNGLEGLILHHKYGVQLATLTTYLRHPDEDPAIFAKGKLVFMPDPVVEKMLGLATGNPLMDLTEFTQPLYDAPEMIPCPRDFDYFDDDWKHRDEVTTYVEPMILRTSLGDITPVPITPDVIRPIPTEGGRILIFGTSGSQVADYEDKARRFFNDLIEMMKVSGMEGYHLVLSTGDKLFEELKVAYGADLDEENNDLPDNVSIAAWVDQLQILPRAKAVFMHGGLATIKESIYYGAPIVIVPHGKDQGDNALRIVRNGVGITPKVGILNPLELKNLFTQVTTDTWVGGRLAQMQSFFQEQEGLTSKPSVGVIQSVLPL